MLLKLSKKKQIAIITLIIMIVQLFSPYGVLINSVQAATETTPVPNENGKFMVVELMYDESDDYMVADWEDYRVVQMNLKLVGDISASGYDVALNYDHEKLIPVYYERRKGYVETDNMDDWYPMTSTFSPTVSENNSWLDTSAGTIRMEGVVASDINPANEGGEIILAEMFFMVADGYDLSDLTEDLFSLRIADGVDVSGIEIAYDGALYGVNDASIFGMEGFSHGEKTITSIELKTLPTKTNYEHGDNIDLTGGEITVNYSDGTSEIISMTDTGVIKDKATADFDDQKVTITHEGKKIEIPLTVTDPVGSIEISPAPTKTEYTQGETIDLSGGTIQVTTKSGKTSTVATDDSKVTSNVKTADLTSGDVTITGTTDDGLTQGKQTITLTYEEKTAQFDVLVNDTIDSISVSEYKDIYNYGDGFDKSQGKVIATTAAGGTLEVPFTNGSAIFSGFDSSDVTDSQTITVGYLGKTTTYDVEIKDYVTGIIVKSPTKTNYNYNEDLDLTGGKVTTVMASGATGTTVDMTADGVSVTGYDKTKAGAQGLTVTYLGQTANFTVIVNDQLEKIAVQREPNKVEYIYEDNLDLTGGKIKLYYASGTILSVDMDNSSVTVTGYNSTTIGTQTLIVCYTESGVTKTTTFEVTVKDVVESITDITGQKETYQYGDSLDTSGSFTANYKSGATESINLADTGVSITKEDGKDFDTKVTFETGKTTATQKVKVTYEGQTLTYPITIINTMTGIEIQETPQSQYNVNEDLQTGLSILVSRADGRSPETIEVTEDMISGFDTSTEGTRIATITYTENGVTKTTTYEYTVIDTVITVVLKTEPSKVTYEYGDPIDLTGATIEVTRGSGKATLDVTESMISAYNPNQLGSQNLTVTYGGITATDTIDITVNDKISDIKVTAPTKVTYEYGEPLELTGGKVEEIMVSGNQGTIVDLSESMVNGFDSKKEGKQTITVTHKGFTKTFEVTVEDSINGIDLQGTPKTEYIINTEFDVSNLKFVIHKTSGDVTVPVTPDMVKGYDKTKEGKQTITIEYQGQVIETIEVEITNPVQKLEWITKPKTSYVIGDVIEVTGGKFRATKADGTSSEVNLSKDMVSGFDTSKEGSKTLTVTYEGQTLDYDITVTDKVENISIKTEPKTEYLYGEELQPDGEIEVEKASGNKETITITPDMISGYDSEKLGNQEVTISYGGQTETFEIVVKDYVKSVVITPPSKVTYNYGDALDLSDAKITKVMASTPNKPEILPVTSSMLSGYNAKVVGPQTVTITYVYEKTYTQNFAVTVIDNIESITLKDAGFKTQYKYGDNLNLNGLSIDLNYQSGNTKNIPVTAGMVTGFNPNKLGEEILTITYNGLTQTIKVNVEDYVEDITLTPPTKKEYKIGEILSLVGGTITENMASGAERKTVALTESMVSEFDSTTPGTKTLIVTYTNVDGKFQKTFQVAIINTVNHIEVIAPTKTDYKYGENLNLSGGYVKVVMEDGSSSKIPLTAEMVTGYQKTSPGQQMLTVTYTDEKSDIFIGYFSVTVGEDYIIRHDFVVPTKKEYKIGDTIDLTGGTITEVYASGKLGNVVELTSGMISGFDSTAPGTKTVTVTYKENTYKYKVTVKDEILGISMKTQPDKIEYKQGESLDVTGGTLNIVKQSGTTVVNITEDMVSGYDSNKTGLQVITVTYEGFTVQFSVLVEKVDTTPSIPEKNDTQDSNKPSNEPTYSKPVQEQKSVIEQKPQEEIKEEIQDENVQEESKGPTTIIGNTDDNQNPPSNGGAALIKALLALLGIGLALSGIILIFIVIAKRRNNVKIYLEEGNEKVLVGKERVSKDNRVLNLDKYYDKYKEDEYKVVLSKSISKKLDQKTVNLIVHDKNEDIVVEYNNKAYSFRT